MLEIAPIERTFLSQRFDKILPPLFEYWLNTQVKVFFVNLVQIFVEYLRLCVNKAYRYRLSLGFVIDLPTCLFKICPLFLKVFHMDAVLCAHRNFIFKYS